MLIKQCDNMVLEIPRRIIQGTECQKRLLTEEFVWIFSKDPTMKALPGLRWGKMGRTGCRWEFCSMSKGPRKRRVACDLRNCGHFC